MALFADNLRAERHKHDLSQAQVAEILGVSKSTISNYECGVTPRQYHVTKLSELFGISADALMGDTAYMRYGHSGSGEKGFIPCNNTPPIEPKQAKEKAVSSVNDALHLIVMLDSLSDESKEKVKVYISDLQRAERYVD